MITRSQRFNMPPSPDDAARQLFSSAQSLQITAHRGSTRCQPVVMFRMDGVLESDDNDPHELARHMIAMFQQLPPLELRCHLIDEESDDDDDWGATP